MLSSLEASGRQAMTGPRSVFVDLLSIGMDARLGLRTYCMNVLRTARDLLKKYGEPFGGFRSEMLLTLSDNLNVYCSRETTQPRSCRSLPVP